MKVTLHPCRIRGFSALDLLIVVATVLVLAGVLLPMLARPKSGSIRIRCVSNLKQVGLGFRLYAIDNDEALPYLKHHPTNSAWNYFQTVGKEIGSPKVLLCPEDSERTKAALDFETNGSIDNFSAPTRQNSALSFFYGVDASPSLPNMILAGDRNISTNKTIFSGLLTLSTNTPVQWTEEIHKGNGNIAMADGSAQQVTTGRLRDTLMGSDSTNGLQRFIIP